MKIQKRKDSLDVREYKIYLKYKLKSDKGCLRDLQKDMFRCQSNSENLEYENLKAGFVATIDLLEGLLLDIKENNFISNDEDFCDSRLLRRSTEVNI